MYKRSRFTSLQQQNEQSSPCVHNCAAITLPGIIVALVIYKGILIGLVGNDVPIVLVVQEVIVMVEEQPWLCLLQDTTLSEIVNYW